MKKSAQFMPTPERLRYYRDAIRAGARGDHRLARYNALNASFPLPISLGVAKKWRRWSETNPLKATALSFVPVVGGVPNFLDARYNMHEGKYLAALGNTLSGVIESIPGGFLVSKGIKALGAGRKALRVGGGIRAAAKGTRATYRNLPVVKQLGFKQVLAPNIAAGVGEIFEPGRGPHATPSIYSQMRSAYKAPASQPSPSPAPVGTALGNYRLAEEAARGLARPFGKAASAQPTLADLMSAIERDNSLGPAERVQISATVRAAASGASESTPLSALIARGFGGLIAAMAAKYFGMGRLGQFAAGAIGYGLTGRANKPDANMKDPWKGWKMLG